MSLSTHVLDTSRGEPATEVPVTLQRWGQHGWITAATGATDSDGRLTNWVPSEQWLIGRYRLRFDVSSYQGLGSFFPEVTVVFDVTDPHRRLHLPLLLSPFGYTTYRGS
jgi:5-hydroxyisourate hydrolase